MTREELAALSKELSRLSGRGRPYHFAWSSRGADGLPTLLVSERPVPVAHLQALRREHHATLVVSGAVLPGSEGPRFVPERPAGAAFERHLAQVLAPRVPALAGVRIGPEEPSQPSPSQPSSPQPAADAPERQAPPVVADLLRAIAPPAELRSRVSQAIRAAGLADREVGRAVGALTRASTTELPERAGLAALSEELALLASSLDADITGVTAAMRDLDQSLPERAETAADQLRLRKLREASARLGKVVRTQEEARSRVGDAMRMLRDLEQTLSSREGVEDDADGDG